MTTPKIACPSLEGVYFVRWGHYIKIGHAGDVVRRRWSIESGIPEGAVQPLGWIPYPPGIAAWRAEQKIHDIFARRRVRGEWFEDCPAIRRFIARWCQPWPPDERQAAA